jgi:hypothetical protein
MNRSVPSTPYSGERGTVPKSTRRPVSAPEVRPDRERDPAFGFVATVLPIPPQIDADRRETDRSASPPAPKTPTARVAPISAANLVPSLAATDVGALSTPRPLCSGSAESAELAGSGCRLSDPAWVAARLFGRPRPLYSQPSRSHRSHPLRVTVAPQKAPSIRAHGLEIGDSHFSMSRHLSNTVRP